MKNLFLAAAGLLLASCAEPELVAPQNPEPEQLGEPITITVGMPSNAAPGTKVSISDSGNNQPFELKWEEGDQLIAVGFDDQNKYIGTSEFTIQSGFSDSVNAAFDGYTVSGATQYDIYYKTPGLTVNNEGVASMSYENMKSPSAGSILPIKNHIFLKSNSESHLSLADLSTGTFALKALNSILSLKLDITEKTPIGDLIAIDWFSNAYTENEKSVRLNVGSGNVGLYYLCFDPRTMTVSQDNTILFKLYGTNKDYFALVKVNRKLDYLPSTMYDAVLSDKGTEGSLTLYEDLKADLFDAQFSIENTVTDISPMNRGLDIHNNTGKVQVSRPDGLSFYVANFANKYCGASNDGVSAFTFPETPELTKDLQDGYSLEAYICCNASGSSESKVFSSTKGGGTALEVIDGKLCFIFNDGGWNFLKDNKNYVKGQWYHVVGVFTPMGISAFYVDGKQVAHKDNTGKLTRGASKFWTIGANSSDGNSSTPTFNGAWNGGIGLARIYSTPLAKEQVFNLCRKVKKSYSRPDYEPVPLPEPMLDVEFTAEGVSDSDSKISYIQGCSSVNVFSPLYKRYIAHFNHEINSTAQDSYYKFDYSDNQSFKEQLSDGHSLEVVFCTNQSIDETTDEVKMFSSHQSGGTGIMLKKGHITFLPKTSITGWCWASSDVKPEPGKYYHVIGVWDKSNEKAHLYIDGVEYTYTYKTSTGVDAKGDFVLPSTPSQWFAIGGDASGSEAAQCWNGDVVLARVYDEVLNEKQVSKLYSQVNVSSAFVQEPIYMFGFSYTSPLTSNVFVLSSESKFDVGDRLCFDPLEPNQKNVVLSGSVSADKKSLTVSIPESVTAGKYRILLKRRLVTLPIGYLKITK